MKKNRLPPLKPKKERELLKAAKPVVTIFSAISRLKKTIAEKEKKINNKDKSSTEIEKLKSELKKKEKELQKLGEKKIKKGEEATRLLLYRNQHLVDYLAAGYYSKGRKIDNEELKSEGIASLPKAIEKFDLNSKNKFSTYAGFWIKQYMQSHIIKSQFINQGSGVKEKKSVIYYDSDYQNDDKENKSYSLLETLHDEENAELMTEQIRYRDTVIQTNHLINALENREAILLARLLSKVKPSNLLDVYYLMTDEEKEELKKKIKLSDKSNLEVLQKYSPAEKARSLPLIKKYLLLFTKNYNFSEISKVLGKSENMTRRLKLESFKKLQKLAKERNLHLLLE